MFPNRPVLRLPIHTNMAFDAKYAQPFVPAELHDIVQEMP